MCRACEVYLPLLLEDESGIAHGNDWANGFLRGMEFGKEDWALLLDDEDYGGSLVAIFALANENNPDPEMRSYKDPISADLRETLIAGAAAGTTQIYRYFKAQRFLTNDPLGNVPDFLRTMPKIGRNDPCPCGSELSPKVGDGGNRKGGISWGCLTPPLLHRRSDMPCPTITSFI